MLVRICTMARAKQIASARVGARQRADLGELADWVEGLSAAPSRIEQKFDILEAWPPQTDSCTPSCTDRRCVMRQRSAT